MKQQMCESKSTIKTLENRHVYNDINGIQNNNNKITCTYIRHVYRHIFYTLTIRIPIEHVGCEVGTEVYETRSLYFDIMQ